MQLMDCEKRLPPASTPGTVGWECELQVLDESADLCEPLNQPVRTRERPTTPGRFTHTTRQGSATATDAATK